MLRKLLVTLLAFFSFTAVEAASIVPQAPATNAKAYILMDADSGAILAAQNADAKLPPASLTKLMALYVAFDALQKGSIHMDDKVLVSKTAWQTEGSRMFLQVGTYPTVSELVQGIIVASGNDASVALAEHVAGSQAAFVEMMNAEAASLGMDNSHFTDVNGLPDANHISSAHDLAILAQALIKKFPDQYHFFSQKWFKYNDIKQPNRNRLLWRYSYADGLKTGHTDEAGFCLVGSAQKDNMRLISVVLDEPSDELRTQDSQALLTYGFKFFKTYQVYPINTEVKSLRVYFGETKTIPAGIKDGLYVTLPEGQYEQVQKIVELPATIKAPVTKDQVLGSVTLMLDNKPLAKAPIIALAADPVGGAFRRLGDHVSLGFSNFFGGSSKEKDKPIETPAK